MNVDTVLARIKKIRAEQAENKGRLQAIDADLAELKKQSIEEYGARSIKELVAQNEADEAEIEKIESEVEKVMASWLK